ncbi:MAG: hypothetical protein ABGY24_14950 [bacterium]|jgi:hypothetical protein|mmetsp:Transcript_10272/g.27983  ORF Transcript_10272/g.27983 Transcript_10272/m.27983 type:complete len:90 (+) Transcript_10272:201-470(+)
MYQSIMLGALVGAGFAPRVAVAAATTTTTTGTTAPVVGGATGQSAQSAPQRKQSGANAQSIGASLVGDDVMRIIRKASIEKAIDLTFWW